METEHVSLIEDEKLRIENINLKKQMLDMQTSFLRNEEAQVIQRIKERTGVDISGWRLDIASGTAINPKS